MLQAKTELVKANASFTASISEMTGLEPAWKQLKAAQQQLEKNYNAAMVLVKDQEARPWCASLRAAGYMQAGQFSRVSPSTGAAVVAQDIGAAVFMLLQLLHRSCRSSTATAEMQMLTLPTQCICPIYVQNSLAHLAKHAM